MWYWDETTGVFFNEAEALLSRETLALLLQSSMDYTMARCMELTTATTKDTMYMAIREQIKREYIRQYLAGIGGYDQMGYRNWGQIGGMLREQYGYIRGAVEELINGSCSEAQFNNRIKMIVNSSKESYNRARGRVVSRVGFDEVGWNLGAVVTDHCERCEKRANMGYVPIGPKGGFMDPEDGECWPGDGNSECLTNCNCTLSYHNSKTGEEYEL